MDRCGNALYQTKPPLKAIESSASHMGNSLKEPMATQDGYNAAHFQTETQQLLDHLEQEQLYALT